MLPNTSYVGVTAVVPVERVLPVMLVISFWALTLRVCGVGLGLVALSVTLLQLPSGSRLQLWLAVETVTVSRDEPLWPDAESVPRAKACRRLRSSYAVELSPLAVLLV